MSNLRLIVTLAFLVMTTSMTGFAQSVDGPIKILGRGILNRDTQEILQLACVGLPKLGTTEASCELLQFVYTAAGMPAKLIGEKITIKDIEDARGKIQTKLAKKELRKKILEMQKAEMLRSDGTPLDEWFPMTSAIGKTSAGFQFGGGVVGAGIFGTLLWLSLTTPSSVGTISMAAVGVVVCLSLFTPIFVDILALPVRAILKSISMHGLTANVKSVQELGNRDLQYWQERATQVSNHSFRLLFLGLGISDDEVLNPVKQDCSVGQFTVEVPKEWGWAKVRQRLDKDRWSGHFGTAPQAFVEQYSRMISDLEFGKVDPVWKIRPVVDFDCAQSLFSEILKSQVKKKYYFPSDEKGNIQVKITPTVKQYRNSSSDSYQRAKSFCLIAEVTTGTKNWSRKVCDASAILVASKLANAIPSCKSLQK